MSSKLPTVEISEDEKRKLVSFCVDYLRNDWESVDMNDVFCARIPLGVCNKNYRCYIKNKQSDNEANDVIIHIYASGVFGDENLVKFLGEASELAVMNRLYEMGMAPKLLAVIPGGRIETFIPGRPPTAEEHASVEISKAILRKLAQYHSLQSMPILKRPTLTDKIYEKALSVKFTDEIMSKYSEDNQRHCRAIMIFPFEAEYKWIQQILSKIGVKVVFSHNDMNPNNVLLKDEMHSSLDERLMIIDYETSTYFYRGFDIAYYLCFKSLKPRSDGQKVTIGVTNGNNQFRDDLLMEYLNESKKINHKNFDTKYDNLEWLRLEVDFFDLILAFYILSLGRYVVANCQLIFPLDFIANFAPEYEIKKKRLLEKYGNPVEWK